MPRLNFRPLLRRFVQQQGRAQTEQELKWLEYQKLRTNDRRKAITRVERRVAHEPLAYILGYQPFGDIDIVCNPPVLIPRPETEDWTLRLARYLREHLLHTNGTLSVLDLGTGTGCIPLLLAHELSQPVDGGGNVHVEALGIDLSSSAVALARRNRVALQSQGKLVGQTIDFRQFDMFSASFETFLSTRGAYDVVTSNPPYIPHREISTLDPSVRAFEDPTALSGTRENEDGLQYYRRISELCRRRLLVKAGGVLVLEFGEGQAEDVLRIMRGSGRFVKMEVWKDPWEKDRALFCCARGG